MKKSEIYEEKGVNLASKVPADIARCFRSQAKERGQKVKTNLAAAAKLWTQLPEEIQARLLNQSLAGDTFIELVRQIADEQIEAGRKAGRALVERRKRSKPQKD